MSSVHPEFDEADRKYLDNVVLVIGVPCYGGNMLYSFSRSLSQLEKHLTAQKIKYELCFIVTESLISRARNNIANHFLKRKDATHLLFLDADIAFNPNSVVRLLLARTPLCGCVYPKKNLPIENIVQILLEEVDIEKGNTDAIRARYLLDTNNPNESDESKLSKRAAGVSLKSRALRYCVETFSEMYLKEATSQHDIAFAEVKSLGTGFMMIERQVFDKIREAYPEHSYQTLIQTDPRLMETRYDYFRVGVQDNDYLSEDWYFCRLARLQGFKSYACLLSSLRHTGAQSFFGCFGESIVGAEAYKLLSPNADYPLVSIYAPREEFFF